MEIAEISISSSLYEVFFRHFGHSLRKVADTVYIGKEAHSLQEVCYY